MANTDYANYGEFAWMYNADPEVRRLIDEASKNGTDANILAQQIRGTAWWRTMVASERQWEAEIAQDPRSALDKRNQKAEQITKQAQQMGITLRPGVADSFADSYYRYGWTDIQLENSLLSQWKYERGKTTGAASVIEGQLNDLASDYGIMVDDATMQRWIVSIEQGRDSVETFKAYLTQQAANGNAAKKGAFDQGATPKDIASKSAEITTQAAAMGVTLRAGQADDLAAAFFQNGWNDTQLTDALVAGFTYERGKTTGAAATIEMQLRGQARDYGVPLSDATMQQWIVSIEQGRSTVDSFKSYLAQIASADNPWMAEALQAGFSVKSIMDPYIQRAAQELGISPDEIDLAEPKWRRLMEVTDPKTGERIRPNSQQIAQMIRTDAQYGWDRTSGAVETAADFATQLAKTFGAV